MKCQICGENEAAVTLKQVVNGKVNAVRVCAECAARKGVEVQLPVPLLTDLLFGPGPAGQRDARSAREQRACPTCQMRWRDFRKSSLLGCPECYRAFAGELRTVLSSMHRESAHVGKVPACEKLSAQILALRAALSDAVTAQNFEEAARLRDAVKDLEARQRESAAAKSEAPQEPAAPPSRQE